MAKQTKTLADVQTVTTVNDDQLIPITDASGNVVKVPFANVRNLINHNLTLDALTDNVRVLFYRKSDNYPLAQNLSKWPDLQKSGEIATGIVVFSHGINIVVALDSVILPVAEQGMNIPGSTNTIDRREAMNDLAGKSNTEAYMQVDGCNTAAYAAGFCNSYYKTNSNGGGLKAGDWWLPSVGELMIIMENYNKINYAMSVVGGKTINRNSEIFSSTQRGAYNWFLRNGDAYVYYTSKMDAKLVLPVSRF